MSQGMIMCASTPEKVEILIPPPGSQIGDRVFAKDFPGIDFSENGLINSLTINQNIVLEKCVLLKLILVNNKKK